MHHVEKIEALIRLADSICGDLEEEDPGFLLDRFGFDIDRVRKHLRKALKAGRPNITDMRHVAFEAEQQQRLRDDMFYSVHGFYPPTQPRGFQIVEHTPRAERDAALIDTSCVEIRTGPNGLRWGSQVLRGVNLAWFEGARDSSWMRGGYESEQRIVTTCDVGADWED